MKAAAIVVLMLLLLIPTAASHTTEYDGATIIDLSINRAVVEQPVSGMVFNITAISRIENITVVNNSEVVNCRIDESFWRGIYRYAIASEENVVGYLRFESPLRGQHFISPVLLNGTVVVVLPAGYTTGSRALGIPRPGSYEIREENRTLVIWRMEREGIVEVSFYKKDAPQILAYFFLLLLAGGIYLAAGYYYSSKQLESIRRGTR